MICIPKVWLRIREFGIWFVIIHSRLSLGWKYDGGEVCFQCFICWQCKKFHKFNDRIVARKNFLLFPEHFKLYHCCRYFKLFTFLIGKWIYIHGENKQRKYTMEIKYHLLFTKIISLGPRESNGRRLFTEKWKRNHEHQNTDMEMREEEWRMVEEQTKSKRSMLKENFNKRKYGKLINIWKLGNNLLNNKLVKKKSWRKF